MSEKSVEAAVEHLGNHVWDKDRFMLISKEGKDFRVSGSVDIETMEFFVEAIERLIELRWNKLTEEDENMTDEKKRTKKVSYSADLRKLQDAEVQVVNLMDPNLVASIMDAISKMGK